MPLDLRDLAVSHDVDVKEGRAAGMVRRVRPVHSQATHHAVRSHCRFHNLAIDIFTQDPTERRDHVRATPAPVGMVVVSPSGVVGEELPERVKVLGGECRPDLFGHRVERLRLTDWKIKTAAAGRPAGNNADALVDEAATVGAMHLHAETVSLVGYHNRSSCPGARSGTPHRRPWLFRHPRRRIHVRRSCALEHRTVDELLLAARSRLDRVAPCDLETEISAGALVVDTRPLEQRDRDGALPGAVVVDRNVLEWRLDPASSTRIAEMTGYDRRVIVVCNEGYSSSLVAATLQELGLSRATDLIGGYQAWRQLQPSISNTEEQGDSAGVTH